MRTEIGELVFEAEPTMREHGEPGTFTLVHGDAEWYVMYRFGVEEDEGNYTYASNGAGRHFSTVRVMGAYPWLRYVEYRRGGMDI
jgi:hypothetical protein